MRSQSRVLFGFVCMLFAFFNASCGQDFKDISTEDGRRAIIEQANNLLTSSMCDQAISLLSPLYFSQYATTEVRLIYASAYACKGGLNFVTLISAFANSGSDIWSALVLSNYSTGSDGKTAYLEQAAEIIRTTARTSGSYSASERGDDANMYMIFIQGSKAATIYGPLGSADRTTGNEGATGWPATSSNADKCAISSAVANMNDSANNVSSKGAISKISSALTKICGAACPTNVDPTVCGVTEQASGLALMTGISTDWTGP